MSALQAVLLATFCYLSGEGIPWLVGDYLGFLVFAKPLVAGLVTGIILQDVQTGILIGASLQTIYIGTMIVGGVSSADEVSVSYIALPLAVAAKGDLDVAVGIAIALGLIGTIVFNVISVLNIFWIQLCDKAAEKADFKGILKYHVLGTQVTTFILRFVPAFIILFYGQNIIPEIAKLAPEWLLDSLTVMGGVLPVVGIMVITTMLIKDRAEWAYFMIGFVLLVFFDQSLISISIIATIIAAIMYMTSGNSKDNNDNEVEL